MQKLFGYNREAPKISKSNQQRLHPSNLVIFWLHSRLSVYTSEPALGGRSQEMKPRLDCDVVVCLSIYSVIDQPLRLE